MELFSIDDTTVDELKREYGELLIDKKKSLTRSEQDSFILKNYITAKHVSQERSVNSSNKTKSVGKENSTVTFSHSVSPQLISMV